MIEFIVNSSSAVSWISTIAFISLQLYFFWDTAKCRKIFSDFFKRAKNYSTFERQYEEELIPQLDAVGSKGSDLNNLISEINNYIAKTKGTTDFSVIQNKVERKLNMRYDQSVTRLAFPTYLGLMGTFFGVFFGIWMFLEGFDGVAGISDNSIKDLLRGVLVSMVTSLWGLILTTINNGYAGAARKKIEEEKNNFYDFVQTELMPTLDVSLVAAVTKLHETIDKFEPSFDRVINRFQTTFDNCTQAFGSNFEMNVAAVSSAVAVMGSNMDKINRNIQLQEKLLSSIKSDEVRNGMERYIEAANHFVGITQSLDKFEEARRMMLAAAQEAIMLQNRYSDSLKIPHEVAVRINDILNRISTFEKNINVLGENLSQREILGNGVVTLIQDQVNAIAKKGKIADRYLGIADGKLEELFQKQTAVIDGMSGRYAHALENHMTEFENIFRDNHREIVERRTAFMEAIDVNLSIEEVHKDFSNLKKLDSIDRQINQLISNPADIEGIKTEIKTLKTELEKIKKSIDAVRKEGDGKPTTTLISTIFGRNNNGRKE